MKLKPLLITIPALLLGTRVFAASPMDSVGVENLNGKKVILHKLDPKDNYYSVGRRYNVRPGQIIQFNNNAALHVGDVIKVPTDLPFIESTAQNLYKKPQPYPTGNQQAQQPQTRQPVVTTTQTSPAGTQQYKVSAGETLYAVSKRFGTTVDNIISLNNLKSNNLAAGQILLVPNGSAPQPQPQQPTPQQQPVAQHNNTPVVAERDTTNVASADSGALNRRYSANRYGLFEKNERGIATWMDEEGLDPNKKLVLHRTAPIGTVVKITNPMTNRTTFAKVVGRFTDNESTKDVIIVMTKNAAESLGALDKRFRVNISYGIPE